MCHVRSTLSINNNDENNNDATDVATYEVIPIGKVCNQQNGE